MGNSGSAANSDNEDEEVPKNPVDDANKDNGELDAAILDLIVLFDPKQLRVVADKIKEDTAISPLQQHHTALTRWLEDRRSRGAEMVSLMQFVDSITNKGVTKEVATEIFQQFDVTGEGEVDLDYLHEMLDLSSRSISGFAGVRSDLQSVTKLLQDCIYAPGFIDAFTTGKTEQANHGQKIFKFLCQNRALSVSMPLPALRGFITTTDMRIKVLNTHFNALKERADSKKREPSLQADEILKPINRCFTSAEVSSNRNDASKLIDNDNGTYWQSDGPARSHWVRLTMPSNVVLKQLSMYVVSSDQSYMPHHVVVYGGRDESNLRELNDVRIPNHITGDFTLLENVKVAYQVIQIAIKRCHSDGCDTRIRQIKAIGYRVVKSKGVSVVDATAMWYLSVLASTAQAALPVAPQLRESIIEHTRMSLSHMNPLSLSSTSIERPGFLSGNVMQQTERFLKTIICTDNTPQADELIVLLQFALSRGSLGSILDALKLILENIAWSYPAAAIFRSLIETEEKAIRKHGQKLAVSLLSCDGGSKQAASMPSNVLSEKTTDIYFTETGITKCNMAFGLKSGCLMQLTRVFLKLSKGNIGPKSGLVFVFDSDNIKDESGATLFQPLEEYNDWTEEDYKNFKGSFCDRGRSKQYEPVAYFSVDKDFSWTDVDVTLDRIKTGSCVVIKFLGPRQATAENLGIISVQLFGYETTEDIVLQQTKLDAYKMTISEDSDESIPGYTIFLQSLHFLLVMCRAAMNLKPSKETTQEKEATVDIHDVSMRQLWSLYTFLAEKGCPANEEATIGEEMLLNLFYMALPYLRPAAQKLREAKIVQYKSKKYELENTETETNEFSKNVFQSLCDIVDNKNSPKAVHRLAKMIILDGAEVFFPDAQTRRTHLLSLVDKVMEDGKAVSLSYTFESLCRFFSSKDATGLLGLPDCLPQANFEPQSVVFVMTTLVGVAYRECLSQIKDEASYDIPSNLVLLLCAMQKSLLSWCHFQCEQLETQETASNILAQYIEMISSKCDQALSKLKDEVDKMKIIDRMENSFVSIAMRQLILFLNLFANTDINFVLLLRHLQPLAFTIGQISGKLPELFSQAINTHATNNQTENTILREWELESEHDYDNNMNFTKVFNCPGCTSFRVEFDPKCQTEERYDYLEFTDSSGCKRRFDQAVGSDKWPSIVEFSAGQRLHFLFHSDGSNTAWGYKFKVSAIGSPDVAVSWIFDLHLNISRCFGIFCGNALNTKKALGIERVNDEENGEERALLHSELWASLFRGGYMIGKLERSLSGFHRSNPSDSMINAFLCSLATGESEKSKEFLEKCKLLHHGQKIGSEVLDSAVHAVFAALLWHTQELREIISSYVGDGVSKDVVGDGAPKDVVGDGAPKDLNPSIVYAYATAESVRRILMERRQKLIVKIEEHVADNSQQHQFDPDTPVISCREKALFLLKFAGLSKFLSRKQSMHAIERRTSHINRNPKFYRQDSYDQKRNNHNYDEPPEKYPSFQLILDFVSNESLSHRKIHDLLQYRNKYANTIFNVYTYASEYISHMTESENLQIPCILFLQSMLSCQDYFPHHYGDYLNGCGLEQENAVRNAFYSFIRKLAGVLASNMDAISSVPSLLQCAQAYLLHFLDVEWKAYDYSFVAELNLPSLLTQSMQGIHFGAIVASQINEDEAELKMYERHKRFFTNAKNQGIDSWCEEHRQSAPLDIQRDMNLFIARYSADLDVVITCDGCQAAIKGNRFRCLTCTDMDLCMTCFKNSVKPNEHNDQHVVIDLRFTCDGCGAFIIETRIHCNECNDFDLCLGCYKTESWPSCHHRGHAITRSRLIQRGLLPSKASKSIALLSYILYRSWLQFSSFALSLSETLQNGRSQGTDREYMKEAGQLLLNCLEKLVECLVASKAKLSPSDKDGISTNTVTDKRVKFGDHVIKTMTTSISKETDNPLDNPRGSNINEPLPVVSDAFVDSFSDFSKPLKNSAKPSDLTTDDDSCYALTTESHNEILVPPMPDLEGGDDADEEGEKIINAESNEVSVGTEKGSTTQSSQSTTATTISVNQPRTAIMNSPVQTTVDNSTRATPFSTLSSFVLAPLNPASSNAISGESLVTALNTTSTAPVAPLANATLTGVVVGAGVSEETSLFPDVGANTQTDAGTDASKNDVEDGNNKESEKEEIKERKETKERLEVTLNERAISLIGAVIPTNRHMSMFPSSVDFPNFVSKHLLPALFTIVEEEDQSARIRMITLGVLSKILRCFGPQISDAGISMIKTYIVPLNTTSGSVTVRYLFDLGAECLKNADINSASGVESILRSLWGDKNWKRSIVEHAKENLLELTNYMQDPSLSSLFSLMFLAGFPDIFRVGMLAVVKEVGNELKNVVVLNHSPEDVMVSVVNFKNRKKMSVKESNVEVKSNFQEIHDSERIPLLLEIIEKNIHVNKGMQLSLERLWVLGLACKALLNVFKTSVNKTDLSAIVESGILSSIVSLASQGTGFSKQWLLRDLEVLSWKLYKCGETFVQQEKVSEARAACEASVSTADENMNATATNTVLTGGDSLPRSPLDGLDEETKLCMETIHDALNCPYPILRAIYEHNGQNREKLLEEVQRSFDGTAGCIIRPSDEVRELAKQWEKKEEEPEAAADDSFLPIDSSVDIGILKFHPQTVEFKDLQAKPEGGESSNTLISSLSEEEIIETMSRQKRVKSSELLKKELENTTRENPREFSEKVNYAVAIGYARHLVGWLFACWQEGDDITKNMLEYIDPQNIVGLLDLIQSSESKDHFQKVVFNFIRCCNKQLLQPLALSAVQCMSEVRLATEARESEHKYKNNSKIEDKVHIPGATSLFIRFDERCSTEYSCDELAMSSSSNFQQNKRVFSGSTDWQDFEMPGDTVYYRFTSDSSNNDWGWKFIVTAGQLGRFETGCSILSALLAQDLPFSRRLPLKQLWSWLVVVACNQVGQQRLMATGLLLRLLKISAGDQYIFGCDAEPLPERNRPNLSLLRPLWTLYTNSIETDAGASLALISPVLRGLSELFLVVENVAQDWGEADELVAGLATDDKLSKCFTKVVKSIAAIGVAIDLPNKALEMLQNAKEPPPTVSRPATKMKAKKQLSTIQLRITGGDGSELDSDDDLMFDDDEDEDGDEDNDDDDDDDDDADSSDYSDLSHPEAPPGT